MESVKKELPLHLREKLLEGLKYRFEKNEGRHRSLQWSKVLAKLEMNPEKIWSLNEMEKTGGEPDVVGFDTRKGEYIFCDCSTESPQGRRNVCYDREGESMRKKQGLRTGGNAVDMAKAMGIKLLTEKQYRELQKLGDFDTKTSSWIETPDSIRSLGGALFADRRFNHVFTYHNGASTFYAARGFRGELRV